MINRILHTGTLALCALVLTGCPKDFSSSDEFDDDIQSIDSVSNQDRDIYRGRVMNGQLENALVWLDQGQDGAVSPEVDSADEEPLPADPWTVTDEDGRFELDVTGFQRDLTEGADWDPRDASVMVIAVPGVTIDHTSGETVDQAYFMMAPPGLDPAIVTPFTTMAETVRRLDGTEERGEGIRESGKDINERLGDTAEFVGVYKDYLNDSDARRMPFYAQALARTIQKQVPGAISDELGGLGDPIDPPEDQQLFTPETLEVIGSILVDQAPEILADVDADIDAQGIEGYSLPPEGDIESIEDFGPDLADPLLLRSKTTYVKLEDSEEEFEANSAEAGANLAAVETYDYDLGTALRRADFQGQAEPSMEAMARLTNLAGRIYEGGAQRGLDLALDEQQAAEDDAERDSGQPPRISDRFLFSWSGQEVADLQSLHLNPMREEIEDYDEDEVDRLYRVDRQPGGDWPIESVVREEELGGPLDFELNSIEYRNGGFERTVLTNAETIDRRYGDIDECDNGTADNPRVVNAKREIVIFDDDEEPIATERHYGHYRDEPDDDIPEFRVLVREYVPDNGESDIERWDYVYFDDVSTLAPEDEGVEPEDLFLDPAQPDLIHSVQIADNPNELAFDSDFCSDMEENEQSRMEHDELDGYIRFEYIRFTDYLNEIGTAD